MCVCVCVCCHPIYCGRQTCGRTNQPGSHRRKVTQDFSTTILALINRGRETFPSPNLPSNKHYNTATDTQHVCVCACRVYVSLLCLCLCQRVCVGVGREAGGAYLVRMVSIQIPTSSRYFFKPSDLHNNNNRSLHT